MFIGPMNRSMNVSKMKCPEKERLQQQCTDAWDAYVSEAAKSELPSIGRNGVPMPPTISELKAKSLYVDRQSGMMPAAYAIAIRLRGKHLAASAKLSKHLSQHRC
jgi:hypothetical protein